VNPSAHHAAPEYWRRYNSLPESVRKLVDRSFELLKTDPHHPSLHLKKVGRYWSVRIGLHHRAVAVEAPGGLLWFWVGGHAEYDQFVGR
jgi:hypothetical protein